MLFQQISALTNKGVKVSIEIADAGDGKLEVSVIPTSLSGKTGVSLVAKSFIATPAELDAEFTSVIASYAAANASLREQLAAFDLQVEQAAADAKAEAESNSKAKAAVKPGAGSTGSNTATKPGKSPVNHDAELLSFGSGTDTAPDEDDAAGGSPENKVGEAGPGPFTL